MIWPPSVQRPQGNGYLPVTPNQPVTGFGSSPVDVVQLMRGYGFNAFRARIFVDPPERDEWGGFIGNSLDYTIRLFKRIKASAPDSRLILDYHYSDYWADPGKQYKPKSWQSLSFEELKHTLYEYTRSVIEKLDREGVPPDMVQVGNEITCGFLWPDGRICGVENPERQWDRFAELLAHAVSGVREASSRVKVIIHIDRGGDWAGTYSFFSNLEKRGVEYDVIGQSFYPFWHGRLSDLLHNLDNTLKILNRPVLIAETGYPHAGPPSPDQGRAEAMKWPLTPEGQRQFFEELIFSVSRFPNVIGVLWWEPCQVPIPGADIVPVAWGATALFDKEGRALPALKSVRSLRESLPPSFLVGADVSSLLEFERLGAKYYD